MGGWVLNPLSPPPLVLSFWSVPAKNFALNGPAPKAPEEFFVDKKAQKKKSPNHLGGTGAELLSEAPPVCTPGRANRHTY